MNIDDTERQGMNLKLSIGMTLLLSGCGMSGWWKGPVEQSRVPGDAVSYQCDNNKSLTLRFLDGEKSVMVIYPERQFRLDQVDASGSGRYSNGRTSVVVTGDEASVEEGKTSVLSGCKRQTRSQSK